MPGQLRICAISDPGKKRPGNEDSFEWWPREAALAEGRDTILMVCDGMGGAQAGERASHLAVQTILKIWRDAPGGDPELILKTAFEAANTTVHDESRSDPARRGMGTTGTAVVISGTDLIVAHVGDSRAYLANGELLTQLTNDHSLVAHLVERGQITAEEARSDPRRNVVTRSIGVTAEIEVDVHRFVDIMVPGSTLLLSSDGLHGVITDEEIGPLLQMTELDQAGQKLIDAANDMGGPDNITVLLARRLANDA
ncbi:MAG: Stp1/IreP family PP2C-type Ser/Thr phosphatase [Candidatus Eisenbacteria bacterium]|nr:Stp1/IreP family PP2C-type Ser/Thr phosphatase [Candidatus Eisenbacteria bacterium]